MIILTILGLILKITVVILLLSWLLFTQWSLRVGKGVKEKWSMQRWFFIVAFLGVFGIYTQWIMFFPAWALRDKKFNPFSWWLDDSRYGDYWNGWAEDYYIHLNTREETIWIAYSWHLRNMIWNLQNKKLFRVKPQTITEGNQNIEVKRFIIDSLYNFNKLGESIPLVVDGKYGQFAGLKYWKNGKSTWQTMNGEQISKEKSIFGEAFYFYKNADQSYEDNQLNWTYTSCKRVKTLLGWRWRTIQIGMKSIGYSRQLKYQKDIELK